MDKELKEKWVAALRSGDYGQTTGCLVDGRGHCCLGVLCEVAGFGLHFWTELLSRGGPPARTQRELALMNDNGKSFEQIADWIEENL